MRVYVPVDRAHLARLQAEGVLPGPLRACAVDPAWRAGAPEVDEEEWEFEAQSVAALSVAAQSSAGQSPAGQSPIGQSSAGQPLPDARSGAGVVLALDLDPVHAGAQDDGWLELAGPVRRRDVAAVLTADLQWFAVQEIPALLGER